MRSFLNDWFFVLLCLVHLAVKGIIGPFDSLGTLKNPMHKENYDNRNFLFRSTSWYVVERVNGGGKIDGDDDSCNTFDAE